MQMLSESESESDFETSVPDRVGAPVRDQAPGASAARPAAPELLRSPRPAGDVPGDRDSRHTISLTTAYGDVVAAEEVPDAEFGAALRRIHDEAVPRASAVIVLDGVTHTRNSFLEFVRQFNDWTSRQRAP